MDINIKDITEAIKRATNKERDELQSALCMVKIEPPPIVKPPPPKTGTIGSLIGNSTQPFPVSETPYTYFATNNEIGNLAQRFLAAINIIAERIYTKYPDRYERRLAILRASPDVYTSGDTHGADGLYLDIEYYRTAKSNVGQIWTDGGDLTPLFDVARNKDLVTMVHKVFPRSRIMVDDRIKPALGLVGLPNEWLVPDPVWSGYHHDTHLHIYCGVDINLEVSI